MARSLSSSCFLVGFLCVLVAFSTIHTASARPDCYGVLHKLTLNGCYDCKAECNARWGARVEFCDNGACECCIDSPVEGTILMPQ